MQSNDRSAIEWFRKGLKNAPSVQPLRLNLARALERSGETQEAHELFRGVYEEFRDDSSAVDYVNFLLRQGKPESAIAIIDESHAGLSDKTAVPLLQAAAQIAVKLGRDSVPYLELSAERAPGNAEVLNALEALYRERGAEAKLTALLAGEAETIPMLPADFLRRSYQANVAGKCEAGLELAERGLELAATDEHLHYNAAVSAAALGRLDVALEHLSHVSSIGSPVHIPSLMLRANVYRAANRADEALGAVEQLLAFEPAHADALALRGALMEARNDITAAEQSFRRLFELDRGRGAVELSTFLLRQGRFEDAVQIADAGLAS
jgi:tetratricopeptide (TPR) repeat protein